MDKIDSLIKQVQAENEELKKLIEELKADKNRSQAMVDRLMTMMEQLTKRDEEIKKKLEEQ